MNLIVCTRVLRVFRMMCMCARVLLLCALVFCDGFTRVWRGFHVCERVARVLLVIKM